MPASLWNSAVRSQIPDQLGQKKKGRGKEARNSREELANIKIFIDFRSPKIPLCHWKRSKLLHVQNLRVRCERLNFLFDVGLFTPR